MYWNEGGGCGGGAASSGGGFSHPVVPVGMLGTSALLTYGEKSFYNTNSNTWRGKNGKLYDMNFNGNQHTGGKNKFAKKMSRYFHRCNVALTTINGMYILYQHETEQIDDYELWSEEISNVLSSFGPWGIAWNIGWELGRLITETPGYQSFKYDLLYKMEVKRIGEPNEYNEHLWREWHEYYEKHK